MKIKQITSVSLTAAVLLGATVAVQATIVNQLNYVGMGYAYTGQGITINYPVSGSRSGLSIGQIKITDVTDTSVGTFNTYCLSPGGSLASSGYYKKIDFNTADPGLNPSQWAAAGGIENASYLWYMNQGNITSNAKGAALQLALWEALYDSTAVGSVAGGGLLGSGSFRASGNTGLGSGSGSISAEFATIMATLGNATTVGNWYSTHPGYVWAPCDQSGNSLCTGQELIFGMTPVPEPTTIIAGALLLLPFGASTLRFMRRNRTA